MDFYLHSSYLEFEKFVLTSFKNQSNSIILSVPGMSMTFYIQKFLEKHKDKNIGYITSGGQTTSLYNFIDLDFYRNKNAIKIVDKYLSEAKINQKFVVIVDTPYLFTQDKFINSYLANHFYKMFYFQVLDSKLLKIFARNMNVTLTKFELSKIYSLSGGISAIAKVLIANTNLLKISPEIVVTDERFINATLPTIKVISKCTQETLIKLGIWGNEQFVSKLLMKYFEINDLEIIDIKIGKDLKFSENGAINKEGLLKLEKKIIETAVLDDKIISKEKIADIKWGKDSYDGYSDEAIVKTILRLNKKLQKYKFIAIPTMGYSLRKK